MNRPGLARPLHAPRTGATLHRRAADRAARRCPPTVFMFPGQSSVYPAMLETALARWPWASAVVAQASEQVGRDLAKHYRAANSEVFASNLDVQIGGFLTNHLHLLALARNGIHADRSLGLSLGEYNHLVHIGALTFESALALIVARGSAYDAGPPGQMACVFPATSDDLESVLADRRDGVVEIACFNAPTQQVIAGEAAAVDAAIDRLDDEGVSSVIIERRIPMHTSPFAPVATIFRAALEQTAWREPKAPYLPNVTGVTEMATPARIVDCLFRHVYRPVRWRHSIEHLWANLPGAVFIEAGPRAVLSNLIRRRWIPASAEPTDVAAAR